MILVDTSVWVRALLGHNPFRAGLDQLLAEQAVGGHELVYGELLAGQRGDRSQLLATHRRLIWAKRAAHDDVVTMVGGRRLEGRGVGWIDLHLVASALTAEWWLWTADARLAAIANELHISWQQR